MNSGWERDSRASCSGLEAVNRAHHVMNMESSPRQHSGRSDITGKGISRKLQTQWDQVLHSSHTDGISFAANE